MDNSNDFHILFFCFVETFFLVNWLDEEDDDLFDVVPSKDVVPPGSKTVLDVAAGTVCRVAYSSQFYRAKIIECGTCNIISPLQVYL